MLNQNHPDDERLSALASHDADATADAALTAHVSSCDRCTGLVDELGLLRTALAELPDIAPARPLRLLPPAGVTEPASGDRLGGWARRFFAPVLASGAALALVGVIGTAAPALDNIATGQGGAPAPLAQEEAAASEAAAAPGGGGFAAEASAPANRDLGDAGASDGAELFSSGEAVAAGEESPAGADQGDFGRLALEQERSPWPMVLFAGVALMIAAVVARWILAPRA